LKLANTNMFIILFCFGFLVGYRWLSFNFGWCRFCTAVDMKEKKNTASTLKRILVNCASEVWFCFT